MSTGSPVNYTGSPVTLQCIFSPYLTPTSIPVDPTGIPFNLQWFSLVHCHRTGSPAKHLIAISPNFKMHFTRRSDSELGQICAQIDALEVYFPMKQISSPNSSCRKAYGQKSEGVSDLEISKIFQMSFLLHRMSEFRVS